jgi:hypothetical protein
MMFKLHPTIVTAVKRINSQMVYSKRKKEDKIYTNEDRGRSAGAHENEGAATSIASQD